MNNSDSFFESEFFNKHRGLITVLTTVSFAFLTIYILYRGLKPDEAQQPNNPVRVTTEIKKKSPAKRRLTFCTQDLLYTNINNIDMSVVYPLMDSLSKIYDLFMIVLVSDNDKIDDVVDRFSVLIEDKIIFKHV